jgi:hypothetical protein
MNPSSPRRLRRVALVAIAGLLLNTATVHIANAAALLRGVPTGEVCDVWGVRMPDAPAMHHAMHGESMAMSGHDRATMSMDDDGSMAMSVDDGSSMAMSMDDGTPMATDAGEPMPDAATPAADASTSHDHSHAHHHHDACEHCALAGLTTFASSAPVLATVCAPAHAPVLLQTSAAAQDLFDAVESWRLHLKRGPPRSA